MHDRCVLPQDNHHRPCHGLDLQYLMVGSWVGAGWRGSLGKRMVTSEGEKGPGGDEC